MSLEAFTGSGELAAPAQEFADFTDAWLLNRRLSANTRQAYRRDVMSFVSWCTQNAVNPLQARFTHINTYARGLEAELAPATVARKLSGLSSWYDYLNKLGVVAANPVSGADRPYVSRDHSATVGLSPSEVDALLYAAMLDSPRHHALLTLMADLGLRVGEAINLEMADLGHERGHRTVRFLGKGGRLRRRALAPGTADALDRYLSQRAETAGVRVEDLRGPVFVTSTGRPLYQLYVFRLVRRLAEKAGIASAARLSPHSLRHAFATTARSEGVPLEDVQDAMGHADPRTTRRYDRDRHNLDRDPSYAIWAARARRNST
jgi:site-specific recombinase XerD